MAKGTAKKIAAGLGIALVSLILIFGLFILYLRIKNGVFLLSHFEVVGAYRSDISDIYARSGLSSESSLLTVSLNDIEKRIEENPLIDVKNIRRRFPDTIIVYINERKPVALITIGRSLYEASQDGRIIIDYKPSIYNLPVLNDFPSEHSNGVVKNITLRHTLHMLGQLQNEVDSFYPFISEIKYTENDLIVYPRYPEEKAFPILMKHSFSKNKVDKLKATLLYLENEGITVSLIDLRFEHPRFRKHSR